MDLDANTLRGIATVLCMIASIGITLWAYSDRKRDDFNDAANLPFADEELHDNGKNRKETPHV